MSCSSFFEDDGESQSDSGFYESDNASTSFFTDLEFARKMEPNQDMILRSVFGKDIQIRRFSPKDNFVLDQKYHIDIMVDTGHGVFTLQAKALRYAQMKYNTFTIEYMQNSKTGEKGEFFSIAAQLYLSGYADTGGSRYLKWNIFRIPELIQHINKYQAVYKKLPVRQSSGNANFLYFDLNRLPDEVFFKRG